MDCLLDSPFALQHRVQQQQNQIFFLWLFVGRNQIKDLAKATTQYVEEIMKNRDAKVTTLNVRNLGICLSTKNMLVYTFHNTELKQDGKSPQKVIARLPPPCWCGSS